MDDFSRVICIRLLHIDLPFSLLFIPDGFDHFVVEIHVLSEAEDTTDAVEVLPDMVRFGVEFRPVWLYSESALAIVIVRQTIITYVQREVIHIRMSRH